MEENNRAINKTRPITFFVVAGITIFAMLCSVALGIFAQAITFSVQGMKNTLQRQHTEAAKSYQQMLDQLSILEETLPEPFDIESMRGGEYRVLKAFSKITRTQTSKIVSDEFSDKRLQSFPYSKFRLLAEEYREYDALSTAFFGILQPYQNQETGAYEKVEKEPIFEAFDKYMDKNPKAPAWMAAIFRNFIGQLLEEPVEERIAYFAQVKDSNAGLEEYSRYLIDLYRQLDMTDEMISLYNRKIALNRNDYDAVLGKGKALIAAGDLKGAERVVRSASSGVSEALSIEIMRRQKDYDGAIQLYIDYRTQQEIKQSDSMPEVTRQIAIVQLLQGDYASAMEYAREAAMVMSQTQNEYLEQALYLLVLVATLAEDEEFLNEFSLELNENGQAIVNAEDTQAALEKVFLEGRGDIV